MCVSISVWLLHNEDDKSELFCSKRTSYSITYFDCNMSGRRSNSSLQTRQSILPCRTCNSHVNRSIGISFREKSIFISILLVINGVTLVVDGIIVSYNYLTAGEFSSLASGFVLALVVLGIGIVKSIMTFRKTPSPTTVKLNTELIARMLSFFHLSRSSLIRTLDD
jgi:hypothetical protein